MLWALVMAGGRGTRLWPLANQKSPKPFLNVIPGKKNLFEETILRVSTIVGKNRIWVIGNQEHLSLLRRYAKGIPSRQIIGEPLARNTAPTIAFCASQISKLDPDAHLLVLPADHWIHPKEQFHKAVQEALRVSCKSRLFSIFGIRPTAPSTSYGYLRAGRKISGSVYQLNRFVEKPNAGRARSFLRAGNYDWHAGIFIAPVKTLTKSLERFAPVLMRCVRKLRIKNGVIGPSGVFKSLPDISIDYAVLEKLKKAFLIRCRYNWCDVGTWGTLGRLWPKDGEENSIMGPVFSLRAGKNIVYTKDKPVFLFGVNDLVVINAPDAFFVTKKGVDEYVREAARAFGKRNR